MAREIGDKITMSNRDEWKRLLGSIYREVSQFEERFLKPKKVRKLRIEIFYNAVLQRIAIAKKKFTWMPKSREGKRILIAILTDSQRLVCRE